METAVSTESTNGPQKKSEATLLYGSRRWNYTLFCPVRVAGEGEDDVTKGVHVPS